MAPSAKYAPATYEATGPNRDQVKSAGWRPPAAQTRGGEWIYDVFTPPEISYDERTQKFAVASTKSADDTGAEAEDEFAAEEREPFRLQLIGYVGGEGNFQGAFENRLTAEVFLAGSGRAIPALGLTITDFQVQRRWVPLPDSMASRRRVATAVVRDERTGRSTTLTVGEPSFAGEPGAAPPH